MPKTTPKRVWLGIGIALAILIIIAGIAGAIYLRRAARPLAGPTAGTTPDVFDLLPADAPTLAYLDASALKTTPNSTLSAIGALVLPTSEQDPDYTEFVKNTGFDYERDLDRAAIAVWPFAKDSSSVGDQNPTVAVADGRFNQQRVSAYALRIGHLKRINGQSIYELPGNPPISFEFLSESRVALASGSDATALLTERNSKKRDPAMQTRINRVAGAPLFAVARTDHLPASAYASFAGAPQLLRYVKSVGALTLAARPQGEDLDLTLDGECKSMADAEQIGILLNGFRIFGAVALKDPKTRAQMTNQQVAFLTALLSKMQVMPQDNWVRLSLAITPQMLTGK